MGVSDDPELKQRRLFVANMDDPAEPYRFCIWNFRRVLCATNFLPDTVDSDVTMLMSGNEYRGGVLCGVPAQDAAVHGEAARRMSLALVHFLQTEIEPGYRGGSLRGARTQWRGAGDDQPRVRAHHSESGKRPPPSKLYRRDLEHPRGQRSEVECADRRRTGDDGLADAGYPDGFKTILNTADILGWPTLAAAVKDQWSKIGVEAEVVVHEGAALWPMLNPADEADR